jgi:hypothetical protein
MTTYLYVLGVEKAFSGAELVRVRDEVCRLFNCTEIEVSGATDFTVHTPLGPAQAERALGELSGRFGAAFRAGTKVK